MIRLVQHKLILPRGDTGSLTIPILPNFNTGDIAVFAIFNPLNKTIIFKKQVEIVDQKITIQFSHNETVNLPAGKYLWDIKAYLNPEYADGQLVNGEQIDSYYAGYKLPECQIRETSDNYLLADNAPTSTLSSAQLDIISMALAQLRDAVRKTQENVNHYPIIIDEEWHTWDADTNQYVNTGVRVPAKISDLIDDSGHYIKPVNGIPADDIADGVIPDISTKADKVSNATNGNFASLDAQGNLIDSGHKHSDYLTEHQDISGKQDKLTFDDTPQLISDNPVKSSGLWNAFNSINSDITFINSQISSLQSQVIGKQDYLYFDTQPKSNSSHPVTSSGIKTAIDTAVSTKQDILTFDATPTRLSNNPVTSSGIKSALSDLEWSLSEKANMIDDAVNDLQNDVVKHTMDISLLKSNVSNLETNKQDKLTFDIAPKAFSNNLITSGGIYDAITNIKTMQIHICTNEEYNSQTGIPIINSPNTKTFYLVPGGEGNNLYIEWIYVNNAWEKFGSATVDLSGKQDVLTFDQAPTLGSTNPVTSNGIKILINAIANGIPRRVSDLTDDSGHYTKPNGGIPASDLAYGVIPDVSGKQDVLIFDATPTLQSQNPVTSNGIKRTLDTMYNQISGETDLKLLSKVDRVDEFTEGNLAAIDETGNLIDSGSKASDFLTSAPVTDVQVGGTSVLSNGVANIPIATSGNLGIMKVTNWTYGLYLTPSGEIAFNKAIASTVKTGTDTGAFAPVSLQSNSAFYGLAKAAGDTTQSQSNNAVGTYTDEAKAAIRSMLGTNDLTEKQFSMMPITVRMSNPTKDNFIFFNTGIVSGGNSNYIATDFIKISIFYKIRYKRTQTNSTSSNAGMAFYDKDYNYLSGIRTVLGESTIGYFELKETEIPENAMYARFTTLADTVTYGEFELYGFAKGLHGSIFYGLAKAAGDITQALSSNAIGTYTNEAKAAIQTMLNVPDAENVVTDVQINETSILNNGIANIPKASSSSFGVIKAGGALRSGAEVTGGNTDVMYVQSTTISGTRLGTSDTFPVTPSVEHSAVFYGLAKAAGDTTQSQSNNAIGTYTEDAQSKIHEMLDAPVTVSGRDPVIAGKAGIRYICGECDTLTLTPSTSGIVDIIFTSGSTPTVLSVPNTVKWPDWFDPTALDASVTYEINIMDGVYGAVGVWT